ncbi:hypothetical protein SAMN05421510_10806 [Nitrosomonas ureae]|uniref:Uncharacterized protein n=1 Tax=Nitrosomonas ureae TaxID=44577 RepID=A0A1H9GXF5_9PROT|nr:hypothetical protein C8R28_10246 [Nitrosomonas ureae]PXX12850.1 hypothetical protein C8R27_12244 [Nitrosomonas ureae]SDU16942.1 hypothetical protein SAMN05216406_1307 [Nitrosomonas ureae]SEQ54698.1 hypothetical protein SAMN05421510_10806 [Nitrosomonas ureae]
MQTEDTQPKKKNIAITMICAVLLAFALILIGSWFWGWEY